MTQDTNQLHTVQGIALFVPMILSYHPDKAFSPEVSMPG